METWVIIMLWVTAIIFLPGIIFGIIAAIIALAQPRNAAAASIKASTVEASSTAVHHHHKQPLHRLNRLHGFRML